METKYVELKQLLPIIKEKLASDGSVIFTPNGTSMKPLIRNGIDEVELIRADTIKKNDIPLFVREDGSFVLHRIIRIKKDGTLIVRGDNQIVNERVNINQIIGKVKKIIRKDKTIEIESSKYRFYCLKSKLGYPFKYLYRKIRSGLAIIFHKIFKKK